jgi:mono/diheme cytochrome c family protein
MNKQTWIVALSFLALVGCGKHEKPNFTYMPDMHYSPAIKAQEGIQRLPVAGTIPRGYEPYAHQDLDPVAAGKLHQNPVLRTKETVARGQKIFNTYCIVCHGAYGEGDGSVVPKYPRPPSLQSDKIKGYADGSIYNVITLGQNLMSSYASQIAPQDRWALVHYIRALQRAKNPSPADMKFVEDRNAALAR